MDAGGQMTTMFRNEPGLAARPASVTDASPAAALTTFWRSPDPDGRLDCETAVLLRACVLREFREAGSWAALIRALGGRGLGLAFRRGQLVLIHAESGMELCSGDFLGYPLAELVARLGRPAVRLAAATAGAGEIRH